MTSTNHVVSRSTSVALGTSGALYTGVPNAYGACHHSEPTPTSRFVIGDHDARSAHALVPR